VELEALVHDLAGDVADEALPSRSSFVVSIESSVFST
jgi:hypothetical protein